MKPKKKTKKEVKLKVQESLKDCILASCLYDQEMFISTIQYEKIEESIKNMDEFLFEMLLNEVDTSKYPKYNKPLRIINFDLLFKCFDGLSLMDYLTNPYEYIVSELSNLDIERSKRIIAINKL